MKRALQTWQTTASLTAGASSPFSAVSARSQTGLLLYLFIYCFFEKGEILQGFWEKNWGRCLFIFSPNCSTGAHLGLCVELRTCVLWTQIACRYFCGVALEVVYSLSFPGSFVGSILPLFLLHTQTSPQIKTPRLKHEEKLLLSPRSCFWVHDW